MTIKKESIDTGRFIAQLDQCFGNNNMRSARKCIEFWEAEARKFEDDHGLLTVLNEAVGLYRRTQKKEKALKATEECLSLVVRLGLENSITGATIMINSATTLSFFGNEAEGICYYDRASAWYRESGNTRTYEYAALLNNRAGTAYTLKRYDEAIKGWREATTILEQIGGHNGEIAISLVMLAHSFYDQNVDDLSVIDTLLDEAWEHINAVEPPRDWNYAYVLKKCAPSFDFFNRPEEAQALREVAKEIYDGNKENG